MNDENQLELGAGRSTEAEAEAAWARLRAAREALAPEGVPRVNLDVPRSAATVLGAIERLRPYEAAIHRLRPDLGPRVLDDLRDRALAAWHAHAAWYTNEERARRAADEVSTVLVAKGRDLVVRLGLQAQALATWPVIPEAEVPHPPVRSALDVATSLHVMKAFFDRHWSLVKGRAAVTEDDLAQVGGIATEILLAIAERERMRGPGRSALAEDRTRALFMLTKRWDELRRCLRFLSNARTTEVIAPSLHAARGVRSKKVARGRSR